MDEPCSQSREALFLGGRASMRVAYVAYYGEGAMREDVAV